MQKAKRQNYHARKDDLPVRTAAPSAAAHKGVVMSTQRIHGIDNSIMFAERGPRQGVNPRTGERITIAGGKVPKFSAGAGLKSKVKGG